MLNGGPERDLGVRARKDREALEGIVKLEQAATSEAFARDEIAPLALRQVETNLSAGPTGSGRSTSSGPNMYWVSKAQASGSSGNASGMARITGIPVRSASSRQLSR